VGKMFSIIPDIESALVAGSVFDVEGADLG
jgi:hypothetical protein